MPQSYNFRQLLVIKELMTIVTVLPAPSPHIIWAFSLVEVKERMKIIQLVTLSHLATATLKFELRRKGSLLVLLP